MPRVIGGRYGLSSKEFTPGHGRRRLRRARRASSRGAGSRSASTTTSPARACPTTRARHRAARDRARGLLRPRLGRHGRREQEHDQDPRRRGGPARAGLLRLRLEEVRLADRLAPALRPAARSARRTSSSRPASSAATSSGCSTQVDVLGRAAPGATLLLNCRAPAGRGLGRAAAPGAGADPRQAASTCTPSTPSRIAREAGLAGAHQHRAADLLLRDLRRAAARARRSSGSRRRSRKTYGRRGAEVVRAQPGRGRPRARRRCTGSRCPSAVTGHARAAAGRARARAGVRAHRDRGDDGRPRRRPAGQRAAGRRHLPERHDGVREAQHLRAGRGLGPRHLHPVRQLQLRLPAQRDPLQVLRPAAPRGRAGRLPVGAARAPSACRTPGTRCRSTSRTAPAAACASRPARSSAPGDPVRKAINLAAARAAARRRAREHRVLRDAAGQRPLAGRLRHRARHPVPRAAVRVLRRLRGLRRDARTSSCSRSCSATG